jgi:hypothetical protein
VPKLFVDLAHPPEPAAAFGSWTIEVTPSAARSHDDSVTLTLAQLTAR